MPDSFHFPPVGEQEHEEHTAGGDGGILNEERGMSNCKGKCPGGQRFTLGVRRQATATSPHNAEQLHLTKSLDQPGLSFPSAIVGLGRKQTAGSVLKISKAFATKRGKSQALQVNETHFERKVI